MSQDLQLLPTGELLLQPKADLTPKIAKAFVGSPMRGVITLASEQLDQALPPGLNYWRGFGREFLISLCQSTSASWEPVPLPDFGKFLAAPPLAPGMEYLNQTVLEGFWARLNTWTEREIEKEEGGLEEWLKNRNPLWRLVGRVTFHLAENHRSTEFPFAFLATYTHKLTAQSQLQHLPLGKAVKQSAQRQDSRTLKSLLAPVGKAAELSSFAQHLLESKKVFQALAWSPSDAFTFLQHVPQFEEAGIIAKVPNWWKGGRPASPKVNVNLDVERTSAVGLNGLLKFQVNLALNGKPLTEDEWEKLVNAAEGLVSIRGQWVEIDREKLTQALNHWQKVQRAAEDGALTFLEGMRMLAGYRGGGAGEEEPTEGLGEWTEVNAKGELLEVLRKLRDPDEIEGDAIPQGLHATLRPYQEAGLNWLWLMNQLGLGACLADDMGLGKTIQIIALMLRLQESNPDVQQQASLLVVPASLVGNWRAETQKFAPGLRVFFAHPSQTPKEELEEADFEGFDLVVTTYSMVRRLECIAMTDWNVLVLDEAQAIKNPTSAQTKAIKFLNARTRLALTGTPIENNVTDLWSLFDFLNPGLLGSAAQFKQSVKTIATQNYAPLRKLTAPYILRRLKTDKTIIADLPDKTEVNTNCPLTKTQAAAYERLIRELQRDLNDPTIDGIARRGLVLGYLTRFKQACNHPTLLTGGGNFDAKHSGKFQRLTAISEEIAARGEKMLVFSQFREMTGPLSASLEATFGRTGLMLHGGIPVGRRQKMVEQFQDPGGPPFFVISLKAGGTGLTLTAASHVIHFDRWWNPAVENQATDRAYRIGQKQNVLVHKFVCPGTIEERIDRLIADKRELAEQVIGDESTQGTLTEMTDEELLRFVAIDLDSAVF